MKKGAIILELLVFWAVAVFTISAQANAWKLTIYNQRIISMLPILIPGLRYELYKIDNDENGKPERLIVNLKRIGKECFFDKVVMQLDDHNGDGYADTVITFDLREKKEKFVLMDNPKYFHFHIANENIRLDEINSDNLFSLFAIIIEMIIESMHHIPILYITPCEGVPILSI